MSNAASSCPPLPVAVRRSRAAAIAERDRERAHVAAMGDRHCLHAFAMPPSVRHIDVRGEPLRIVGMRP